MSTKKDKTSRVYLRIDPALKELAQSYCDRHGVTLSALVTSYLRALLVKEALKSPVDAEQF